MPFDSEAVVTGRITTPFDVCAKPELFVVVAVCSVLAEATVMLETMDDDVAEQAETAFKFFPLCGTVVDISSTHMMLVVKLLSSDPSVVGTSPTFKTMFCGLTDV